MAPPDAPTPVLQSARRANTVLLAIVPEPQSTPRSCCVISSIAIPTLTTSVLLLDQSIRSYPRLFGFQKSPGIFFTRPTAISTFIVVYYCYSYY